jgi:zinc transport system substrate-binding protein
MGLFTEKYRRSFSVNLILGTRRAVAALGVAALVGGCSSTGGSAAPDGPKLKVVAGLYPLAEAARRVGGSRIAVVDLTSPGMRPSGLTIGPDQIDQIRAADVVIDVGGGFQPAVEEAAVAARTVAVLPAVGGTDPHVWLDPVVWQKVVVLIAQALVRADPAGRTDYLRGARDYTAALGALDISYRSSLSDCARHDLVTSQPAFARLAARYGLVEDAIGPPSPERLAALAGLVKTTHATTVFTEPLVSADSAQALARASHVRTKVLDPIEGLAPTSDPHATYLSLMDDNLAALISALGCSNSEG